MTAHCRKIRLPQGCVFNLAQHPQDARASQKSSNRKRSIIRGTDRKELSRKALSWSAIHERYGSTPYAFIEALLLRHRSHVKIKKLTVYISFIQYLDTFSLALPDRFFPFFFVWAGKRVWSHSQH